MITNAWLSGKDDITEALALRSRILGEKGKKDKYDEFAAHLLVYDDGVSASYGRLFLNDDNKFYISHVCVDNDFRSAGIGDLTVKLLLYKGFEFTDKIYAAIPAELFSFFMVYGFQKDETLDEGHIVIKLEKDKCVYPSKCKKGV